ncbi:hypothetical protein [Kamptonema formosum]|nr:hypothetical protein [Oscillatoria sp. PCC 10802]
MEKGENGSAEGGKALNRDMFVLWWGIGGGMAAVLGMGEESR